MCTAKRIWGAIAAGCLGLLTFVCPALAQAPATRPATTRPAAPPRPAPEVLEAFRPATVVEDGRVVLRYRMMSPPTVEQGRKYPLVLVLHGAGERGTDNAKQLVHGAAEWLGYGERFPAYVVFPQCPPGTYWDGPNKVRVEQVPAGTVAPMPQVIALLERLKRDLPVDDRRVYVMGLSMGGFGTFSIVHALPDTFAAAAPICGGGEPSMVDKLAGTPFWIFHGDADTIVPVERSRQMHEALRAAGAEVKYTEYPGVGHDSWTPTFGDPAVVEWMFSQRRRD